MGQARGGYEDVQQEDNQLNGVRVHVVVEGKIFPHEPLPLIYGYLRVTDLCDHEIWQLEDDLKKFAEAKGLRLAEIAYDYHSGDYSTFYHLAQKLKQTQVCHLVVPSLDHLSTHPLHRAQLIMRLQEAGVQVWVARS